MGLLLGYVAGIYFDPAGLTSTYIGGIVGLVAACLAVISVHVEYRNYRIRMKDTCRRELDDGRIEKICCTVHRAVKLAEVEDEGPGYFLDVEDGILLFLQGQEFEDLNPFPAECITLTRYVASGRWFDEVEASGKRRRPLRTLKPIRGHNRKALMSPGFFHGSLGSIEQDVPRLKPNRQDILEEIKPSYE